MTDSDDLSQLIQTLHVLLEGHRGDLIIETSKKILAKDPQSLDGYIGLTLGYNRTQQFDLLLETSLKATSFWPHVAWFRFMHYLYYYSTGEDWYKAKQIIEEAIKLEPSTANITGTWAKFIWLIEKQIKP